MKRIFDGISGITKAQLMEIIPKAKESDIDKYLAPLNSVIDNYDITNRLEQAHFIAQLAIESNYLSATKEGTMKSWSNPDLWFTHMDPKPDLYINTLSTTTNPTKEKFLKKMKKVFGRLVGNPFTETKFINWSKKRAKQNGNIDHGDGPAFCGRGLIQVTWRNNYKAYAKYRQKEYGETGTIDRNYLIQLASKIENNPIYAMDSAAWFWNDRVKAKYRFKKKATVRCYTLFINGTGLFHLDERKKIFKKAYEVFDLASKHGTVDPWLTNVNYLD